MPDLGLIDHFEAAAFSCHDNPSLAALVDAAACTRAVEEEGFFFAPDASSQILLDRRPRRGEFRKGALVFL